MRTDARLVVMSAYRFVCRVSQLRLCVAAALGLSAEKVHVAKHMQDTFSVSWHITDVCIRSNSTLQSYICIRGFLSENMGKQVEHVHVCDAALVTLHVCLCKCVFVCRDVPRPGVLVCKCE
jgi:hypothetical protein